MPIYCLLAYTVSSEKSVIFQLFFSLIFSSLIPICQCVFSLYLSCLGFTELLQPELLSFYQIVSENSSYYISYIAFTLHFPFWELQIDVIHTFLWSPTCLAVFSVFHYFFHVSVWIFFIDLALSLLILSSAMSYLLLNQSNEVLVSDTMYFSSRLFMIVLQILILSWNSFHVFSILIIINILVWQLEFSVSPMDPFLLLVLHLLVDYVALSFGSKAFLAP